MPLCLYLRLRSLTAPLDRLQAKRIANKPKVNMDRPAAELATLLAQREVELARLRAQVSWVCAATYVDLA